MSLSMPLEGLESNPFPPTHELASNAVGFELAAFLDKLLTWNRAAHDAAVFGTSPAPWQLLTWLNQGQTFPLGSPGRFQHPTFGIIQARFVKVKLGSGLAEAFPVRWTNQIWEVDSTFDPAARPAGIMLTPSDGFQGYGWLIEKGFCPLAVLGDFDGTEDVYWGVLGLRSLSQSGRPLGLNLNLGQISGSIPAGMFFVSPQAHRNARAEEVEASFLNQSQTLTALQGDFGEFAGTTSETLSGIQATQNLQAAGLASVTDRVGAVELQLRELNQTIGNLPEIPDFATQINQLGNDLTEVRNQISSTLARLSALEEWSSALGATGISQSIADLNSAIAGLNQGLVEAMAGGGGGLTLTEVEIDLGPDLVDAGSFLIPETGLTPGKIALVFLSPNDDPDVVEMEQFTLTGLVTSPTEISVHWHCSDMVSGLRKFIYVIGV